MKNFKQRAVALGLIVVMGVIGLAGCGSAKIDGSQAAVTIDGENVSVGTANLALRYSQAQNTAYYQQLSAMYGADIGSPNWEEVREGETKSSGEIMKDDVLNRLEEMCVVRAHAGEYGVELDQTEKDAIIAAAKEFIANNDTSILSRMGVTESDVADYLELETYYEKAYEPMIADKEVTITDEEAKQSTVTYTFLSTNNLEEAEAQEKMEALLEEYKAQSDIPNLDMVEFTNAKDDGFMTTTASFGENEEEGTGLDSAVKEAAKTLEDGEMYPEVIKGASGGGFFIVRMDKTTDAEATASKKESLTREKQREAFDEMVDTWVSEADVTVNEKEWKKVKLTAKESYIVKPAATPEPAELPLATEIPAVEEPTAIEEPQLETEEGPVEE